MDNKVQHKFLDSFFSLHVVLEESKMPQYIERLFVII